MHYRNHIPEDQAGTELIGSDAVNEDSSVCILQLFDGLSKAVRQILELRFITERALREVLEYIQSSLTATKTRLYRALTLIKRKFERQVLITIL